MGSDDRRLTREPPPEGTGPLDERDYDGPLTWGDEFCLLGPIAAVLSAVLALVVGIVIVAG